MIPFGPKAARADGPGLPDPGHLQSAGMETIPAGPTVRGSFAESMAPDGHGNLIVSSTQWGEEQPDGSWTDNVDFDGLGRARVTNEAGHGSLLVVSRDGHLRLVPTPTSSPDFPTQAVAGPHGTVYVETAPTTGAPPTSPRSPADEPQRGQP